MLLSAGGIRCPVAASPDKNTGVPGLHPRYCGCEERRAAPMTMDLTGPGGERQFNLMAWRMLLDLALRHGWRPAGALEPEGGEEDACAPPPADLDAAGHAIPADSPLAQAVASLLPPADDPVLCSYCCNSGVRVAPEDALALAEALERALPDVPSHDAMA